MHLYTIYIIQFIDFFISLSFSSTIYCTMYMYYIANATNSIDFLSGLISKVTLKCGHLANQTTICVPEGDLISEVHCTYNT